MPNWCSTKIDFVGNTDTIIVFHTLVQKYTSESFAKSDFKNDAWLGNILHGFGFGDRIDSKTNPIRCRGYISDITDISLSYPSSGNSKKATFSVWTETAYTPMVKMWSEIIKTHFENCIEMYWIAEEIGCSLYMTNNIAHFDELYRIECCADDNFSTEYFNDTTNAINYINNFLKTINANVMINDKNLKEDYNFVSDTNNSFISCLRLIEVSDEDVD